MLDRIRDLAASVATKTGQAALSRAPEKVQEAVEKIRVRYEEGRIDAQKALEELAAFEEQAVRATLKLIAFPWVTAGAIRELYGKVRTLEEALTRRDEEIRELEKRIKELESDFTTKTPRH